MKEFSLLAREGRNSTATGRTGFTNKSFNHVACLWCQSLPAPKLANREGDLAISASQAIRGAAITTRCCARLNQLSRSLSGTPTALGAVRFNHPHLDLVRSIGVCSA